MMFNLTRFLPALFALVLLNVSVAACAQKKDVKPDTVQPAAGQAEVARLKKTQSEGCRTCHGPGAAAGTEDFSAIYDNPASHHPVGARYPDAAIPNFAQPNGRNAEGAFFDRNGNGRQDSEEIMLFGAGGDVTVECASCHKEHGDSLLSPKGSAGQYLRFENKDSAMCTTCHQY